MTVYDIALVGCGDVTTMHLDGYLAHPERVRVVAACDPSPERRAWLADTYGVRQTFASVEDMIAGSAWDVAVVCTPTTIRQEMVETLASAGKHMLVEKPLAQSYAEADWLVRTCAKADVVVAVNQNFRDHYGFGLAGELIAGGRLGQILGVSHQDLFFRQDRGWRIQAERHALSVMGVHWLDGFRVLLGREATWVWCRTASSPAVTCAGETEATMSLLFDDIALSYVQSFSSPFRRTETLVLGEHGTLQIGYDGVRLIEGHEEPTHWENPCGRKRKPESAYRSLDRLLRALEDGEQPANSGEDNLNTIALLEAAYTSAQTGQAVTQLPAK